MNRALFYFFLGLTFVSAAWLILHFLAVAGVVVGTGYLAAGRLVWPIILLVVCGALAANFSPQSAASKEEEKKFGQLGGAERAGYVAGEAARRLKVREDQFDRHLCDELRCSPNQVMCLFDELGDEFGVPISDRDYPEVHSIDGIAAALRERAG